MNCENVERISVYVSSPRAIGCFHFSQSDFDTTRLRVKRRSFTFSDENTQTQRILIWRNFRISDREIQRQEKRKEILLWSSRLFELRKRFFFYELRSLKIKVKFLWGEIRNSMKICKHIEKTKRSGIFFRTEFYAERKTTKDSFKWKILKETGNYGFFDTSSRVENNCKLKGSSRFSVKIFF